MVELEKATFAAGCFWGVEAYFRRIRGVVSTTVGYTGGKIPDPTYEQVCTGRTGHAEAIEIEFDPSKTSYERLLKHFWKVHDPTTKDRQGNDVGTQYRSAIFYHSQAQKEAASASKKALEASGKLARPVTTQIVAAGEFYDAEKYHQDYLEKNPGGYCHVDLSNINDET